MPEFRSTHIAFHFERRARVTWRFAPRGFVSRVALGFLLLVFCLFNLSTAAAESDHHPKMTSSADPQKQPKKEKDDKDKDEKGSLDEFEHEATKPDTVRALDSTEPSDSDVEVGFWLDVAEIALYPIAIVGGGAVGSWYRMTGSPEDEDYAKAWGVREYGEPTVPIVGFNASYQNVASDIEGYDARLEAGFGPMAVLYRYTRYEEKTPADKLELSWLHGVMRLSYTRYFEIGLGFGAIYVKGDKSRDGFSFALPMRVEPSRYFGFDYRPVWGWINNNTIKDHDIGMRVGLRYVSLRAGYRWTKAGSATLEGPVFGILFSM